MDGKPEQVRIIACGMIAREVLDIIERLKLGHLSLTCLPAMYHHHPEKIAPAIDKAICKARSEGYERIFVGYADCGTGGDLDKVCERHGVERIIGPHCFAFFMGMDAFTKLEDRDMTAFYMTDFLARHFDTFLIEPLGLDRHPELRDMYFGNYEKLVFLAQTEDDDLTEKAKAAAERLGLAFERRFTGYGDLSTALLETAS
ncbi:MAG: DUF1638 domain-containing protein [Rhodobiaceae bacterium]|nr:DUF1638 domain-containing protein [Rhodobiaceae bacterium]MCC0018915.1 DUF1638 domain-containing protein [Rhodobiaceae bacterium]MCC0051194.1 DUF1638 domain-containing protein [Rhodobiaceae bacterium]MCC0059956.1 DUF1638 domain-containing protein [Rhodobiaceae bacterium]